MSKQLAEVKDEIRARILSGDYPAGAWLKEAHVAADHDTSRTIVKLAFTALESEGLLEPLATRGYRVASFSPEEVFDAIALRAQIEGRAARLAAERGLGGSELRHIVEEGEIPADAVLDDALRTRVVAVNARFHGAIEQLAGSRAIGRALAALRATPLSGPSAIVFDPEDPARDLVRLRRAQEDHRRIAGLIAGGEGRRAEAMMAEHILSSADHKRRYFDALKERRLVTLTPGIALIAEPAGD
ncbi:transcriptional regulator, GntR family [Tistlia consotensis]|uniref:Transcriptional regulator, GntR family n=1 Tax=Tistlia consotensis USBA 355 TaxID=560819 RepID=A0A1Y6CIU0_9PROT|nr:GntR family transcriptional regulator [Tistlia consotensis]SMF68714.1 transcriptional regulator, GntR family [Tistlia consotensis USBA 355]SNS01259.1 transcriptional regulator, GntR family [Tistlia consotensis]